MQRTTRLRDEQGQAMTEFALILPVFALILFGILQFGVAFNNYLTVTDAVRTGARKAAVSRQDPNGVSNSVQAVRNAAGGLDQSTFNVTVNSSWNPGDDVTVSGSYPYSISLFGLVVASGNLTSTTTERVE